MSHDVAFVARSVVVGRRHFFFVARSDWNIAEKQLKQLSFTFQDTLSYGASEHWSHDVAFVTRSVVVGRRHFFFFIGRSDWNIAEKQLKAIVLHLSRYLTERLLKNCVACRICCEERVVCKFRRFFFIARSDWNITETQLSPIVFRCFRPFFLSRCLY